MIVAYFDFSATLCAVLGFSSAVNAGNVRKTAEDAEDFAENAEKKSN
jgi:hypothetical protein